MGDTWHVVEGHRYDIRPVEVERFNDKSVWTKNSWSGKVERQSRSSGYSLFFETRDAAIEFVEDTLRKKVVRSEERLEDDRETMANFLAAKESGTLVKVKQQSN